LSALTTFGGNCSPGRQTLASGSRRRAFEIIKYLADDPLLYEYFFENKRLSGGSPERPKVLCCAEMMANFLEHIVLQRPSPPSASKEAWMLNVRDHYYASGVVGNSLASEW
jgi:hypothetical protein